MRGILVLSLVSVAAWVSAACAEQAIALRSQAPVANDCVRVLADLPTGSNVEITTAAQDLAGWFGGVRDDRVLLVADGAPSVEIIVSSINRIVRVGKSRAATYAKRGLLIGAVLGVLTSIRSHASASWAALAVVDFGGIGAAIGAVAGSSAHDAEVLCEQPIAD